MIPFAGGVALPAAAAFQMSGGLAAGEQVFQGTDSGPFVLADDAV